MIEQSNTTQNPGNDLIAVHLRPSKDYVICQIDVKQSRSYIKINICLSLWQNSKIHAVPSLNRQMGGRT